MSILAYEPTRLTAADLVISDQAREIVDLRAENRQLSEDKRALVELLADIVCDKYGERVTFLEILQICDEARLTAVRERDALLAQRELEA